MGDFDTYLTYLFNEDSLKMSGLIIGTIISLLFAYLLWLIAEKRGANTKFWAVMGAVFGPLAIPFVFLARANSLKITRANKS